MIRALSVLVGVALLCGCASQSTTVPHYPAGPGVLRDASGAPIVGPEVRP